MYCAICKHEITDGFLSSDSHEWDCPIFVSGEQVAEVIADEANATKPKDGKVQEE